MKENQETIAEWGFAIFGRDTNPVEMAARANVEMAELMEAVSFHDAKAAANEIADVIIILMRLATFMDIDVQKAIDTKMHINRNLREWRKINGRWKRIRS